jgi:hypothetical protein
MDHTAGFLVVEEAGEAWSWARTTLSRRDAEESFDGRWCAIRPSTVLFEVAVEIGTTR